MKSKVILFIISLITLSCSGTNYPDGFYCVEVDRYNPRTQKESAYTLTADIKDNKLVRLYFPNGGYMDYDDFEPCEISTGKTTFSDFNNIQFRVTIIKKGTDCFDAFPKLKRCSANTKSGKRCKNKTRNESGRCYLHDNNH